jgi:hypothetical protein
VELQDNYQTVIYKAELPNFAEQEIIFIDLTPPETAEGPEGEKATSKGELDWWAKCSRGEIDPRPRVMSEVASAFNRILNHGGFFVIFAQPRLEQALVLGKVDSYPPNLRIDSKISADNWSFLQVLSPHFLQIDPAFGQEMRVLDYAYPLFQFLDRAIRDATYSATFTLTRGAAYRGEINWVPLLSDKFERSIGGLLTLEKSKGCILILPQIPKEADTILTLVCEILPDISPHLFPHIEGFRWVERDEYELDSVLKYKAQKTEVQQRAKRKLEELDKKISNERNRLGFLHGIITNTGEDLVLSIKLCLELIEFKQILDVDEQIQNQIAQSPKQEDLQIHDKSPTLLLEIKGLSGLPRESDTLQVVKYIPRRMREWGRVDVRGVSIINHQRNIPALERENENVFTRQQIEDAENNDITLLSAWSLFLLVRGMMNWGWDPKVIQSLFYISGRMPRFPTNYKPIGEVSNYWEKLGVVGVQISENRLYVGQRIGYVIHEGYLEEEISSLQVEKQGVEEAVPGQLAGVKTIYSKSLLRKGTVVCEVIQ